MVKEGDDRNGADYQDDDSYHTSHKPNIYDVNNKTISWGTKIQGSLNAINLPNSIYIYI